MNIVRRIYNEKYPSIANAIATFTTALTQLEAVVAFETKNANEQAAKIAAATEAREGALARSAEATRLVGRIRAIID